ncbi:protein LYRIC-like [Brienomyrus brachyistius]|uniref:protein LYRIC-like n=1 Tax=Brienomyrus brachyistius TaxID=42636 RepID=UPI0020B2DFCD|nr:protein LYRIC-like [Brienomyrus brachyistius]
MAASWQDVAIEWGEVVSDHVRELLSSGLGLLRSRLGVDLGLKPELYPTWAILIAALAGPLAFALLWAAACGVVLGAKRRSGGTGVEASPDSTKALAAKAVKADEQQKKRSRKKPADKKPQPNGRTVTELQEEVKDAEENLKVSVEVKTEKAKKKNKKQKAEVNQTKSISTHDGKEPDEGTWETKISNREKRQQRRKDKTASDDSGSPGGVEPAASISVEPLKATVMAAAPVVQIKNKGEPLRSKAGKGDPIISQVSASWNEILTVNGRGWNEGAPKMSAPVSSPDGETWTPLPKAGARRNPESPAWIQENEGSWSAVDGRGKKSDQNPVSISTRSVKPIAAEPVPDLEWESQRKVDDEWSGLNGMVEDPSSDWNAPSVRWGNYEEADIPSDEPYPEAVKGSDDEKEKDDSAAAGSGKSKKKKKKKKKQGEETGTAPLESEEPEKEDFLQQVQEPTPPTRPAISVPVPLPEVRAADGSELLRKGRPPKAAPATLCPVQPKAEKSAVHAKESVLPKSAKQAPRRSTEAESAVKQASPPTPLQKKSEENWESPKQVKKKKARRET